jgi:hypothetical protein
MPNANDGAAANHRGNDNGGGQIIGSGGNAGPGLTNAPAKYRTEPAPTGEGGNIRGDKSAATGTNQNQNQRNGYNYGNYGYIGNPWSSDFYGWYGDSYPEGANYYEPVYSDNSNGGQSSPSTAQPAAGNGTQSQSSSTGSNSTVPSPEAAQAQLTNAVDKSPAMVAANTAVQSAQAAYDSERARIISTLKDKPDYQQALARKNTATEHVDAVKGTGNPNAVPTPAVTNAATVKMDASEDVTRIEEQAIAADPKALEAKTKLNTAIADRDALRAKLMAQH